MKTYPGYLESALADARVRSRQAANTARLSPAEKEDLEQDILLDLTERMAGFDPAKGGVGTFTGLASQHHTDDYLRRLNIDRSRICFGLGTACANAPEADPDDIPLNDGTELLWSQDQELFAESNTLHDLQAALAYMNDEQIDLFDLLRVNFRSTSTPLTRKLYCAPRIDDAELIRKSNAANTQYISHAPLRRPDTQFVALALNYKFDVPITVGQFGRNSNGLGIAVLEQFGVGHGKPLNVQWMYMYIPSWLTIFVNTWIYIGALRSYRRVLPKASLLSTKTKIMKNRRTKGVSDALPSAPPDRSVSSQPIIGVRDKGSGG